MTNAERITVLEERIRKQEREIRSLWRQHSGTGNCHWPKVDGVARVCHHHPPCVPETVAYPVSAIRHDAYTVEVDGRLFFRGPGVTVDWRLRGY